ncbi:hypothetical protein N431DRAFT_543001 [Stipitochalara longipes BDJ]|nr:hypothetical protein N431DRAFT_543001 [Stipitochalara longipes BDJ]
MASQLKDLNPTPVGLIRPTTYIDRKKSKRVVPMKVLCFGLGRTGTASLRAALIQLEISDVYHMAVPFGENTPDVSMWVEAIDAKYKGVGKPYGKEEWNSLLGDFMAVTDFPCVLFIDELIAAYPEAKIILTVHDSREAWYKSVMHTLWTGNFMFGPPKTTLQTIVQSIVPRPHAWPVMQRCYDYTPLGNFPSEGREWYDTHNERIRKFAEEKLFLEYNVKEEWGSLCRFLEVEEPNISFPRVNDTKAWLDMVEHTKMESILTLLGKTVKVCIPVVLGSITLWYTRKSA